MGYALTIQTQTAFVTVECGECGIVFAVSQHINNEWRKTKQNWHCPNGHVRAYIESTVDTLRAELAAKKLALTWEKERAASLDKALMKERTATAKLKRRVSVGVCPCCQRTVSQLARHMATKHPEFGKEDEHETDTPARRRPRVAARLAPC